MSVEMIAMLIFIGIFVHLMRNEIKLENDLQFKPYIEIWMRDIDNACRMMKYFVHIIFQVRLYNMWHCDFSNMLSNK